MKDFKYYSGDDIDEKYPSREDYKKYHMYKKGRVLSDEEVNEILNECKKSSHGIKVFCEKAGILLEEEYDFDGYKAEYSRVRSIYAVREDEFRNDLIEDICDSELGELVVDAAISEGGSFSRKFELAWEYWDFANSIRSHLTKQWNKGN